MMKLTIVACFFLFTAVVVSCKTDDNASEKLTYIFNGYKKIGTKEYLDVKVSGGRVHSDILVLVEDWRKLEGIRSTKGVGYRGSELKGFMIKAVSDPVAKYSYKDLEAVMD